METERTRGGERDVSMWRSAVALRRSLLRRRSERLARRRQAAARRDKTRTTVGTAAAVVTALVAMIASWSWKARAKRNRKSAEPPAYLRCPVTHELMEDPVVVCTTGQTYDRGALEQWFQRHKPATDPTTNVVLSDTAVVPNWALREALTDYHKTHRLAPLAPPAVQPVLPSGATPVSPGSAADVWRARAMPLVTVAGAALCGHVCAYSLSSLPGYLFLVMCACLLLELDNRRRRGEDAAHVGRPV